MVNSAKEPVKTRSAVPWLKDMKFKPSRSTLAQHLEPNNLRPHAIGRRGAAMRPSSSAANKVGRRAPTSGSSSG
jgi:hypothetical protein